LHKEELRNVYSHLPNTSNTGVIKPRRIRGVESDEKCIRNFFIKRLLKEETTWGIEA